MIKNRKLFEAIIQLFNCIVVDKKSSSPISNTMMKKCIENGFIFDPNIKVTTYLINSVSSYKSLSGEKLNASFHKSWHKIANASEQQLFLEQALHYLTTYGFEDLGIYDKDSVYLPSEKLEIPSITEDIKLIQIKAITKEELLDKVIELSSSGIALKEETLENLFLIIQELDNLIKDKVAFTNEVKNRELKIMLYKLYDIAPSDPVEYLRYVIYVVSGETLLIKNQNLISKIIEEGESSSGMELDLLLDKAPSNLASIFLRYRVLFLALKKVSENKSFFNRLRKDAKKKHLPLQTDYFNSITYQIANKSFDLNVFKIKLDSINIFRKIRLLNALSFRLDPSNNIVYKIRNGRNFVETFDSSKIAKQKSTLINAILVLKQNIADNIDIKDKVFYIPEYIEYSLPTSEKQFIGNFPNGTSIKGSKDIVAWIYWENIGWNRIDLDLAGLSATGKVGWDAARRNEDVLFSGDITDAPNGASEVFHFSKATKAPYLMTVNYHNYCEDIQVPSKIFVGIDDRDNVREKKANYLIDPNNILASADVIIKEKQSFIGLVYNNRFYFSEGGYGNSITSGWEYSWGIRDYFISQLESLTKLKDILELAWATIVTTEKELKAVKSAKNIVNLAPNEIDKTTILNILSV